MRDITGSIISVTQRLLLQIAALRMKRGLGPLIEKPSIFAHGFTDA